MPPAEGAPELIHILSTSRHAALRVCSVYADHGAAASERRARKKEKRESLQWTCMISGFLMQNNKKCMNISFSVLKLCTSFLSILKSTHCSKAPPNVQYFLQTLKCTECFLNSVGLKPKPMLQGGHSYASLLLSLPSKMSILAKNPPGRASQGLKRLQSIPIQYLLVEKLETGITGGGGGSGFCDAFINVLFLCLFRSSGGTPKWLLSRSLLLGHFDRHYLSQRSQLLVRKSASMCPI